MKTGEEEPSLAEEAALPRTLWMLECYNGSYHELIPIYAISEEDANQRAETHIHESEKSLTRIGLHPFPGGFVIHRSRLPGRV